MPDDEKQSGAPRSRRRRSGNPFEQLTSLLTSLRRSPKVTEDHIQSILNVRHALASSLGRDLFSDPAFEILLELYAAKLAGERTSLRGLAAETHLPASTIARWITAFGERGLVTTWRPETGPEELFVDLTPQTGAKLNQLADQWIAAFLSI